MLLIEAAQLLTAAVEKLERAACDIAAARAAHALDIVSEIIADEAGADQLPGG